MDLQFFHSISDLSAQQWDSLWPDSYPFTQHGFFHALEKSQSIGRQTGWMPLYLVLIDKQILKAAMPLFLKGHSYGEYVFDWAWANAYAQAGLEYYPKLISAIPFTPSTGHRMGFHPTLAEAEKSEIYASFLSAIKNYSEHKNLSGFHCLFPVKNAIGYLEDSGLFRREGYQFHWFNNHDGELFESFDEFLETFSSRKRKTLKKERRRVDEQNIKIVMKEARDLSDSEWQIFYQLYHTTYLKRSGGTGYLGEDFFQLAAKALPTQILVACAYLENQFVAAALYFRDETTLYGRYWGSRIDLDCLHFEACYYQGIEYAIKHKLKRFDPGAQGEHKIQRGFTPIKTCSYHWLAHPQFSHAIKNFVREEAAHNNSYVQDARSYLPFKEGVEVVTTNILLENSTLSCTTK